MSVLCSNINWNIFIPNLLASVFFFWFQYKQNYGEVYLFFSETCHLFKTFSLNFLKTYGPSNETIFLPCINSINDYLTKGTDSLFGGFILIRKKINVFFSVGYLVLVIIVAATFYR